MTSQIVVTPAAAEPQLGADFPASFSLDMSSIPSLFPDDDTLDDWFLRFASDNEDLGYQFEIDKRGRLLAMASEGLDGVQRLGNIYVDLSRWTETGVGGLVLTGNALVKVTGAGRRAPDAGWIAPDQLEDLPPAGQRPFGVPFAPRFVVEIVSPSNRLEDQRSKMEEWVASGVALGWFIDPFA